MDDAVGSATVPAPKAGSYRIVPSVALAGLSPAKSMTIPQTPNGAESGIETVFGGTPKTAVGTTALPKAKESHRLKMVWQLLLAIVVCLPLRAATNLPSYYAHPVELDSNGVIAPWYHGLNGQLDERLNIAVNVYKRYPWVDKLKAVMAAPDFIYTREFFTRPKTPQLNFAFSSTVGHDAMIQALEIIPESAILGSVQ